MPSKSNFGEAGDAKPFISTSDLQSKEKGRLGKSIRGKFVAYRFTNPSLTKVKIEGAGDSFFEIMGQGVALMVAEDYEEIKAKIGLDRLIKAGIRISGLDQNAVDKLLIEQKNKEKKSGNN